MGEGYLRLCAVHGRDRFETKYPPQSMASEDFG